MTAIGIGVDLLLGFGSSSRATPLTIAAGCKCWLPANAGVTTSGGAVSAWTDASGTGNNGAQGNAPEQPTHVLADSDGKPSVSFTGGDNIEIADHATMRPAAFTVAFWLDYDAVDVTIVSWVIGNGAAGQRRFFMRIPLNTTDLLWRIFTANAASFGDVTATSLFTVGSMHHYAFTYDPAPALGSRAKVYKDGALFTISDAAPANVNTVAGNTLYIGDEAGAGTASVGLDGDIDDFVFYDNALTLAQVQALRNSNLRTA